MNKKLSRWLEQIIIFAPLAGIVGVSFLKLSTFQHQLLILFVLVWANVFFLYKSWLS